MKAWLKDASFRSLVRNTSYQAWSKGIAAVCSVAALAYAGRGLGAAGLGVLILIQSYVQSVSGIAKFQSWQLVVRFGSGALVQDDPLPLQQAIGFALGLDLLSATIGSIAAIFLLPMLAPWLHITAALIPYARLYCLLLPTMSAATPIGVLRALDRFDLIGWQGTITPVLRAILSLMAWAFAAPFLIYLGIWFATALCGDVYWWLMAWRELRRRGLLRGIRPVLRPQRLKGAWKFAINVNLVTSLNATAGPVANLLVGGILGAVAAGIYRVARTIAQSVESPADFLEKAFYPEVLRVDCTTDRAWRLMLRSSAVAALMAGAMCAIILIVGRHAIPLIFGGQFRSAYPLAAIMLIGTLLAAISFPTVPMLFALDRTNSTVTAKMIGTAVFLFSLYPMCRWIGLAGAGTAFVLGEVASLLINLEALRQEYQRIVHSSDERLRPCGERGNG